MVQILVNTLLSTVAAFTPGTVFTTTVGNTKAPGKARLQVLAHASNVTEDTLDRVRATPDAMKCVKWGRFTPQQSVVETSNECHLTATKACMVFGNRAYGSDYYGEKMSKSDDNKFIFKYVGNKRVNKERKYDGIKKCKKTVTCLMRPKSSFNFMATGPLKLLSHIEEDPQHNNSPTFLFEMENLTDESAAVINEYINSAH